MGYQGAYGIHHEQHLGMLPQDLRQLLQGVVHPRGGLGGLHEKAPYVGVLPQGLLDGLRLHGIAPGDLQFQDLQAVGPANLAPPFTELAPVHHQHLFARTEEVVHRSHHASCAAGGQDEHIVSGLEQPLQALLSGLKHGNEVRGPVMNDGLGHPQEHLGRHRGGPWGKQVALKHRKYLPVGFYP